jgi:hypothetical protein
VAFFPVALKIEECFAAIFKTVQPPSSNGFSGVRASSHVFGLYLEDKIQLLPRNGKVSVPEKHGFVVVG